MMAETNRAQTGRVRVAPLVFVSLVTATVLLLLPSWCRARREAWRTRCVSNLCIIQKGMMVYLHQLGNDRWYPCPLGRGRNPSGYNGAEWLASLYWTGFMEYADSYLCPATNDSNAGGRHVGKERAAPSFGPETVSYAAMHWRSLSPAGSPIPDDYPSQEPMVSDDTQGTVNHAFAPRHGMNVMFFDSHVEWKTAEELNPEAAVGKKGGLLEKLKN